MAKFIKIRCNGPKKCINEVDLDKVIGEDTVVLRHTGSSSRTRPRLQDRYVYRCRFCAEGEVIITRQVIERNL